MHHNNIKNCTNSADRPRQYDCKMKTHIDIWSGGFTGLGLIHIVLYTVSTLNVINVLKTPHCHRVRRLNDQCRPSLTYGQGLD